MSNILSLADRHEAAERARKRAEDRIEEREHIRLELKTREYIQVTHQAIDVLIKGYETQRDASTGMEMEVPLDRSRVQAIKASADLSLRLLNKVLPDLKAVEVGDSPEKAADPKSLSTGELLSLIHKLGHRPTVVVEQAEVVDTEQTEVPDPGW